MIYEGKKSKFVVLQKTSFEHTFYNTTLVKLSDAVMNLSTDYKPIGPTMLVEWSDD